jgi:hypothetical protein
MEGEYCCASSRIVLMRIEPHGVLPLGVSKGKSTSLACSDANVAAAVLTICDTPI